MEAVTQEVTEPIVWDGPIIAAMPVFNEEETIGSVVLSCKSHVDEVLCVDDGSSDATGRIAQDLGALVVRHEKNQGYGAAINSIFNDDIPHSYDIFIVQ